MLNNSFHSERFVRSHDCAIKHPPTRVETINGVPTLVEYDPSKDFQGVSFESFSIHNQLEAGVKLQPSLKYDTSNINDVDNLNNQLREIKNSVQSQNVN